VGFFISGNDPDSVVACGPFPVWYCDMAYSTLPHPTTNSPNAVLAAPPYTPDAYLTVKSVHIPLVAPEQISPNDFFSPRLFLRLVGGASARSLDFCSVLPRDSFFGCLYCVIRMTKVALGCRTLMCDQPCAVQLFNPFASLVVIFITWHVAFYVTPPFLCRFCIFSAVHTHDGCDDIPR